MYHFAKQKEVNILSKWCIEVIHKVQIEVSDYFTFDFRLIGSGEKRLVTENEDNCFDLDYNVILQKDKKDLLNDPKKIKEIFINAFNKILKPKLSDYKYASDSTSVITLKKIKENNLLFSFDVAIIVESNNGCFYRIINDKNSARYIWNEVKNSIDYFEKFKSIKEKGKWISFKNRYLELKNIHFKKNDQVKSFSIFLETLNEF